MPLVVYLDTDVLLDLHSAATIPAEVAAIENALRQGSLTFVCSELTLIEVLVHSIRSNNIAFEARIRGFLASAPEVDKVPVSTPVLERGLQLRVQFGLKTPDAIHIATGQLHQCDYFLTRDQRWSRVGVPILTISELAAQL